MAQNYLDGRGRGRTMTTRARARTSSINFVADYTGADPYGIAFEDEETIERRMSVLSGGMRSRAITMRSRLNTITSIIDGKEVQILEEPKTNWRSLYIVTFISMFNGMQFSVFFSSLWPFLHTIDHNASSTFFGIITSSYCLMQTISGPFYGMWMNRSGTAKYPLATGIAIMALANVLYACVEMFPEHQRRYMMLAARAGVGVGSGCLGVTRAYAATASTLKDRARAVTFMSASFVIGLTIGPGLQVAFTPIGDGFKIGSFHLSEYTAPAIFAVFVDCMSLLILFTIFYEDYAGLVIIDGKEDPFYVLPMFKKLPAFACILSQFSLMFVVTNGEAIGSMYTMAMFDWTDNQATIYNGILQAVGGVASLTVYIAFAWKLGQYVSQGRERIVVIFAFSLILIYHVVTYPFPFLPSKVDKNHYVFESNNSTEITGCLTDDYHWCDYTKQVNLWVYLIANVFCMSLAFPMATISTNTLYSKVLGSRQQGTMQSIQLMAGSTARTLGPLLITTLFEHFGPEVIWGVEIFVIAVTIVIWLILYRVIVPLDTNPVLKPGEYIRYDKGYKYKF